MKIFLMGGTGLVGSRLVRRLLDRNDQIVLLTRRPAVAREKWGKRCAVVEGDPMQAGAWMDAVEDCEAVINLVGEGIFNKRWRAKFKELLRDSRVKSTEHIAQALARNPKTAAGGTKTLVNASAIGYYGPHGDEELTEDAPPGTDFLASVCVDWERAARAAETHGVRVAIIRVGVVLDKEGGALRQMITPFKCFVGGPVGLTGRQVVSWVHHEDLVGLFLLALDNPQVTGPMNGTAPNPVTNKQFSKALGRALGRPSFLPMPKFMLRVILGQVAGLVTTGQRVVPRKALQLGYAFKFPEINEAMKAVLA